jgi:ABC-type sugar transport system ATPase subunit
MDELIRINTISKSFGATIALDNVSFEISKGKIHAIVGENGAGKSTLMKILAGVHLPDSGSIFIKGKKAKIIDPVSAKVHGISIVFQEMKLFPELNIVENVFLGREEVFSLGFLKKNKMRNETVELLRTIFHEIDVLKDVEELTLAEKQIVEIARGLAEKSEILILDEPNSALNEEESQNLFKIINELKSHGITIIYVSHRLDEVIEIADYVTVLRDGKFISTNDIKKTTVKEIISQMIGKKVSDIFPRKVYPEEEAPAVLKATNLSKTGFISDINFEVHSGEIVGFAGLEGAGVDTVFKSLFGLEKLDDGEIMFEDKKIKNLTTWIAMEHGWALVPAERNKEGLMINWSIKENITLPIIDNLVNKIKLISGKKLNIVANKFVKDLHIVTDSINKDVEFLSGGNQQKTVIAKWLATKPGLLILNDPTRGIDIGSKIEIYSLIGDLASKGLAILFTSSELDEIIGLCHRIYVFYNGRIIKVLKSDNVEWRHLRSFIGGDVTVAKEEIT